MDSLRDLRNSDLVDLVRKGDREAWVALTDRYTGLLWSVARSMRLSHADAADAVQTTWLRLVESLHALRDPERLGGWLATTMRRECLAVLRRVARVTSSTDWDELPAVTDPMDEGLIRDERRAALWKAFAGLRPACQRLLRVLMADPPPSYADVAAALDLPVGSIGPTRQRCLATLRRMLAANGPLPA
jgi:RNA polymerase sigma factor (sigma-70 family)